MADHYVMGYFAAAPYRLRPSVGLEPACWPENRSPRPLCIPLTVPRYLTIERSWLILEVDSESANNLHDQSIEN